MDPNDLQQIVKEITDCLRQHLMTFNSTIKRLEIVEAKSNQPINEIQEMKEKSNINDGLILSNRIAILCFEYFIKPIFRQLLKTESWNYFTNKLKKMEDEELYAPLVAFLQPSQDRIPVSLTDIRFLKNDRVDIAYIRHTSTREKLLLIEEGKIFIFLIDLSHQQLVKTMINALDQHMTSSRRCTCTNCSFFFLIIFLSLLFSSFC